MRFLMLQNFAGLDGVEMEPMTNWAAQDIEAHTRFRIALNWELTEAG